MADQTENRIRLSEVIAPAYAALHQDVKAGAHTEYWLKGGRSSLKSSFISAEIVLGMMKDPRANAVVLRKTENTLRGSVYEQLLWAVDMLGVGEFWYNQISPMMLIYRPTGQRILFRGADDPKKLKSTKVRNGYVKYIWYEELDEFHGMEEVRTINQTFVRGGPIPL
jgi:PBSX family phage terminase large subunit